MCVCDVCVCVCVRVCRCEYVVWVGSVVTATLSYPWAAGLLDSFRNNNKLLEEIQKCLEEYLTSKRLVFPRWGGAVAVASLSYCVMGRYSVHRRTYVHTYMHMLQFFPLPSSSPSPIPSLFPTTGSSSCPMMSCWRSSHRQGTRRQCSLISESALMPLLGELAPTRPDRA